MAQKGYPENMQDRLFEDPKLVQFYDAENGWADDTRFCLALAEQAASVLDLGCCTGLLAAALGGGREVWGVDPAGAMLDVARKRPGGSAVTWVEADGRSVRLGRRFDLVVMTGHAFQCLLTDADQRALCETIAAHLTPRGTFIFNSRNPAREMAGVGAGAFGEGAPRSGPRPHHRVERRQHGLGDAYRHL